MYMKVIFHLPFQSLLPNGTWDSPLVFMDTAHGAHSVQFTLGSLISSLEDSMLFRFIILKLET
jgi:hypothetical protein